jgi:hypothetical protein
MLLPSDADGNLHNASTCWLSAEYIDLIAFNCRCTTSLRLNQVNPTTTDQQKQERTIWWRRPSCECNRTQHFSHCCWPHCTQRMRASCIAQWLQNTTAGASSGHAATFGSVKRIKTVGAHHVQATPQKQSPVRRLALDGGAVRNGATKWGLGQVRSESTGNDSRATVPSSHFQMGLVWYVCSVKFRIISQRASRLAATAGSGDMDAIVAQSRAVLYS